MSAVSTIPSPYIHSTQKRRKNIWYSIMDGNWNDPNTWMSNAMSYCPYNFNYPGQANPNPVFPAIGDDVYISHAVTFNVPIITINNLFISASGIITKPNSVDVILNVSGNVQCLGTLNFTGTGSMQFYVTGVNNFVNNYVPGNSSIFGYINPYYNQDILNLSYNGLTVAGNGTTKYMISNLVTTGRFLVSPGCTLQIGTYDLTVGGQTFFENATVLKPSSGTLIFIGQLSAGNVGGVLNLSGNPTVECRGGVFMNTTTFTSGTNTWNFTTNNQNVIVFNMVAQFNNPVSVVGAITVTNTGGQTFYGFGVQINNSLNGTTVGSTWNNSGGTLILNITSNIMTTGAVNFTSNANSVVYLANGSFTLQYTGYYHLQVRGTGTKTLLGNTILNGDLQVGAIAANEGSILQLSTFDFTVLGATTIGAAGVVNINAFIKKSGAGNVIFTGLLHIGNGITNPIDFPGNPTVELKGGIESNNHVSILTGTSTWTFSTNNQTILNRQNSGTGNFILDCPVLISGAIKLTYSNNGTTTSSLQLNTTLNGNNASSEFDNRNVVEYKGTTRPMVTGILTVDAATNTFKYNKAGAQDVKGATYRTIEFANSGVKTLQGNVVVDVTAGGGQSTTGTASVALNGFTITNI